MLISKMLLGTDAKLVRQVQLPARDGQYTAEVCQRIAHEQVCGILRQLLESLHFAEVDWIITADSCSHIFVSRKCYL